MFPYKEQPALRSVVMGGLASMVVVVRPQYRARLLHAESLAQGRGLTEADVSPEAYSVHLNIHSQVEDIVLNAP